MRARPGLQPGRPGRPEDRRAGPEPGRPAGWLLIGAGSGKYSGQLITRRKDGTEAAALLQRGEVVAAAAARFAIEPPPLPRMKDGWVIGMAVKKESDGLARALQAAVNTLTGNGELGRKFAAGQVG